MQKYVTKPEYIEAIQVCHRNLSEILKECGDRGYKLECGFVRELVDTTQELLNCGDIGPFLQFRYKPNNSPEMIFNHGYYIVFTNGIDRMRPTDFERKYEIYNEPVLSTPLLEEMKEVLMPSGVAKKK